MSLTTDVITQATEKHFTNFSDAIKGELQSKMDNHSISINYASEFKKYNDLKNSFAGIGNPSEEQ